MTDRDRPTEPQIQATQLLDQAQGMPRREVRAYLLRGGPDALDLRVSAPHFRLGSHPSNDLVLEHDGVSRFHLAIEAGPRGFRIRDLGSTNGTFVDGLRVLDAFLPPRALLRLGRLTLTFDVTDQTAALEASEEQEFHGLLGRSPAIREVFAQLERAAPSNATVLLEGESGTGKELAAAALHRASPRAGGAFVVLDCAAVPQSLMESELFGHERGAFTGAVTRADGRFREADGGTLFLDEIGELPLEMQPKLLRVLESRQVRRLGATATEQVDVRLVAATNRDLAREVNRGTFREDLYYRLAVVQVRLPPLRQRAEDVRLLVERFIGEALRDTPARGREIIDAISAANWRKLEQLPWPGNVRELRNFIERTLILSGGPIETQHLPAPGAAAAAQAAEAGGSGAAQVDLEQPFTAHKAELVASFEKAYLFGQLARHDNNVSAAARAAGMDRMNFKRLLKKHR
jgi:DNA-binding NtrC family response regulator